MQPGGMRLGRWEPLRSLPRSRMILASAAAGGMQAPHNREGRPVPGPWAAAQSASSLPAMRLNEARMSTEALLLGEPHPSILVSHSAAAGAGRSGLGRAPREIRSAAVLRDSTGSSPRAPNEACPLTAHTSTPSTPKAAHRAADGFRFRNRGGRVGGRRCAGLSGQRLGHGRAQIRCPRTWPRRRATGTTPSCSPAHCTQRGSV
mmetsp:Transcript_21409/g.69281  ORF Transcript_21409/g.69281 Transcript_21409/m.69281 type:complete len:204 (-) Transcript_21409:40-651(-)